jgi:hypothetical protein
MISFSCGVHIYYRSSMDRSHSIASNTSLKNGVVRRRSMGAWQGKVVMDYWFVGVRSSLSTLTSRPDGGDRMLSHASVHHGRPTLAKASIQKFCSCLRLGTKFSTRCHRGHDILLSWRLHLYSPVNGWIALHRQHYCTFWNPKMASFVVRLVTYRKNGGVAVSARRGHEAHPEPAGARALKRSSRDAMRRSRIVLVAASFAPFALPPWLSAILDRHYRHRAHGASCLAVIGKSLRVVQHGNSFLSVFG